MTDTSTRPGTVTWPRTVEEMIRAPEFSRFKRYP